YRRVVGGRDVVGKPIRLALPELEAKILRILDDVYREGRSFTAQEYAIPLDRGQGVEEVYFTLTFQPMHAADGAIEGVLAFGYDVTTHVLARRKSEETGARLAGQNEILEMIANGSPLKETLSALAILSEGLSRGAIASILLMNPAGTRLVHGAAPNLPGGFYGLTDQVAVGPETGSCGASAHGRIPVIAENIETDPRWEGYREAALSHGLRACWSVPILSPEGKVLGTFAMY